MDALNLPLPLRTIDEASALRRTRALFAVLAATVVPLTFEFVGADHALPNGWIPTALLAAIGGAMVARLALRSPLKVFAGTLAGGALGGVFVAAGVFVASAADLGRVGAVAAAYGAVYGLFTGALLGVLFAGWSVVVRRALAKPSADAAERLSIVAATVLGVGAGAAAVRFRLEVPHAAAVGLTVVASILTLASMLRVTRLARFESAVSDGDVGVVPRVEGIAPAPLVWAPVLDHALVRQHRSASTDAAPFRAQSAQEPFALVPGDLGLVRKALGRTVLLGVAGLAMIAGTQVALVATTVLCASHATPCATPCGTPCSTPCEH